MPTLYIVSTFEDLPIPGPQLVKYPEDFPRIYSEYTGQEVLVVVTDELGNLRYPRLVTLPTWQFYRIFSPSTLKHPNYPTIREQAEKCRDLLPNYKLIDLTVEAPAEEEVLAPEKVSVPMPEKTLFLVQDYVADQLYGTVFSKTGKSIQTPGKNIPLFKFLDLGSLSKQKKPYLLHLFNRLTEKELEALLDRGDYKVILVTEQPRLIPRHPLLFMTTPAEVKEKGDQFYALCKFLNLTLI